MGVIRFAIKSSIAGGVVYYTVQEGLWSKPEESVKTYARISNAVKPYITENIPKEVTKEVTEPRGVRSTPELLLAEIPSVSDMTSFLKASWNKGVSGSIKLLIDLPHLTSSGIDALLSQPAVKEALGKETASTSSK